MTLVIPWGAMVAGRILATILFIVLPTSLAPVANIGSLVSLVGLILFYYVLYQMLNELKNVTKNPAFAWWPIIVPIYNIIFLLTMLPPEVTKAKQMVGAQEPTRSPILYLFLAPWALASDLNDIAARLPPG